MSVVQMSGSPCYTLRYVHIREEIQRLIATFYCKVRKFSAVEMFSWSRITSKTNPHKISRRKTIIDILLSHDRYENHSTRKIFSVQAYKTKISRSANTIKKSDSTSLKWGQGRFKIAACT